MTPVIMPVRQWQLERVGTPAVPELDRWNLGAGWHHDHARRSGRRPGDPSAQVRPHSSGGRPVPECALNPPAVLSSAPRWCQQACSGKSSVPGREEAPVPTSPLRHTCPATDEFRRRPPSVLWKGAVLGGSRPESRPVIPSAAPTLEATMTDEQKTSAPPLPAVVDRATWQAQIDSLLVREKAHTREGDAIAAARRRLPMVEVDPAISLTGEHGPVPLLEVFEGRRQLIAYFLMWHDGQPAEGQCEGCTFFNARCRRAVLPALARRHLRHLLPGAVRRERRLPRLHGLGHALVFSPRLRRGPARRTLVRHAGLLPAR